MDSQISSFLIGNVLHNSLVEYRDSCCRLEKSQISGISIILKYDPNFFDVKSVLIDITKKINDDDNKQGLKQDADDEV